MDIVRMHAGSLVYWPGRGDGTWGDGAVDCPVGFAGDREITVTNPPAEINPELDAVYLTDVNADGMDDVVQVRYSAIDVWFNKAGLAFTDRVISTGTPFAPAFSNRVRVVDIDGSATPDVLYANSGNWRWVDLMAGHRPRLLETVTGSLGGETTLEYASSAEDYLADLRGAATCTGSSCERFTWESLPGDCDGKVLAGSSSGDCVFRTGGSPVISTVVRGTTTDSGFGDDPLIVNAYAYHDAYYDGAEHEFRGFGAATEQAIGDANHPTSFTRTYYHQGRRDSAIASDLLADNPNEPLKGQAFRTESWDEDSTYLSTSHTAVVVRELHIGLDDRIVRDTVALQSDSLLYDVADFTASTATLTLPHVVVVGGAGPDEYVLPIRATRYAHMRSELEEVDNLGQPLLATKVGRVRGEEGEDLDDETIVTFAEYVNVDDSATGWLWRTATTHVEGHGSTTDLGATTFAYSSAGDPLTATVAVDQASTYSFSPTLGSPSPEDLISSQTFDGWGNVTAGCAGGDATTTTDCLRYGTATYDEEYAAFPESQAQAVRRAGGGGFEALTTTATWDRALGAVTSVTDPNEEVSTVTYDGFGRLTSLTPPPVVGCDEGMAATRISYQVATPGGIPISRVLTDALMSCDGEEVIQSIAYVDGLGRARMSISTGDGTEGHAWVRGGYVDFDARGTAARAYDPEFYSGSTSNLLAATARPDSGSVGTIYDAFGRPRFTSAQDDALVAAYVYHALSRDIWDASDIEGADTPTTERTDGHGRVIDQVIINKQLGSETEEFYRLWTTYRADGAVVEVTRAETTDQTVRPDATIVEGHEVTRTFDYDTAGRRIATTDPDTDNPGGGTWRYLFNRASDLVAVRDPRGCGQDFYYDHAGRPLAEKYIGCSEAQVKFNPSETASAGSILWTETEDAEDVHVLTVYDDYGNCWEADPSGLDDYPAGDTGGLLGRVACSADRAQRTLFAYDRRGQVIWQARQVELLNDVGYVASTLSSLPASPAKSVSTAQDVYFDEVNTWVAIRTYDHAGRGRQLALPPALGFYATPRRVGRIDFNPRGLPLASTIDLVSDATGLEVHDGEISWTSASIDSHPVVQSFEYEADGQVRVTKYGDGEEHNATVSAIAYDIRRRPVHAWTERDPIEPPDLPESPPDQPLWEVTVPFDQDLEWNTSNDLVSITDNRDPTEWPAGHLPQNVSLQYDDLHHVVDAAYTYSQESGPPTDEDAATDWREQYDAIRSTDALRGLTAPMVAELPEARVANLQWAYDWLGNMTAWIDDAGSFYERSLTATDGPPIANGADLGGGERPSALYLAGNLTGGATDRGGYVELTYGVGGNVATMTVHAQCVDAPSPNTETCEDPGGTDLDDRRDALHDQCKCGVEQHYQYLWDEVNRLIEARRYDRTSGTGSWGLQVVMHMVYDGANQRIARMTYNPTHSPAVKWNVEVYPGDLELHDTYFAYFSGNAGYWPNEALGTETHHLLAGARIVWNQTSQASPVVLEDGHRITVPLTDLIGTSAAVMDLRSGQLLESSTYYPNGARETFRSHPFYPDPEEDPVYLITAERQGFTGKEADEEIGVTYFGERWLISRIGRWLSPDPLAIHRLGGGEAMNTYHYVSGGLLQRRDPLGLDGDGYQEDVCYLPAEQPYQNGNGLVQEAGDTGAKQYVRFANRIGHVYNAQRTPWNYQFVMVGAGIAAWAAVAVGALAAPAVGYLATWTGAKLTAWITSASVWPAHQFYMDYMYEVAGAPRLPSGNRTTGVHPEDGSPPGLSPSADPRAQFAAPGGGPPKGSGSLADVPAGSPPSMPSYVGDEGLIYRSGGSNPSSLKVRPGEDGLSFRDSLSNPIPLDPKKGPVFRPGDDYIVADTAKLPAEAVVRDGIPPGHVTVKGLTPQQIKDAIVTPPTKKAPRHRLPE
jgi:RHS repeat-associated protein